MLLNYRIGRCVRGSLCVGDRCVWVGVVSVLQAEAQLQPATRTLLKPNRNKSPTHNEPRTKQPMW